MSEPERTKAGNEVTKPPQPAAHTVPWEPTVESPPMDSAPSARAVPGYEILGELGRGGMGVVFKARQISLNRIVALKMILDGELASAKNRDRFRSEATAAARLQHPAIVQLFEFGEAGGLPYFTLEFIDGGNLFERLNGLPQPPRSSAELIETVARAIHYAHRQGVVHRDLKPGNILMALRSDAKPLAPRQRYRPINSFHPKVSDFGLAKRLDSLTQATRTGAVLGTPSYMSPEQAAGRTKELGPATDIYALGTILYEMLVGRPPFQSDNTLDTIHLVTKEEPLPPSALRPGLSRDLETICLKCLRKQPNDRYHSAEELADDLRRWLDGQPIKAKPASIVSRIRGWIRRRPTAAAIIAISTISLMSLLALGVGSYRRLSLANEASRISEASATAAKAEAMNRLVKMTINSGQRCLDDGDLYQSLPWYVEALKIEEEDESRAAIHRLRLASILSECPELISSWYHKGRVSAVALSSDGQYAASAGRDGLLRLQSVSTGAGFDCRHDAPVTAAAFISDSRLVTLSDGRLRTWIGKQAEIWDEPTKILMAKCQSDRLAVLLANGKLQIWDADSKKCIIAEETTIEAPTMLAMTADGSKAAAANEAGKVIVTGGKPFGVEKTVTALALARTGESIAVAAGRKVWVYESASGNLLAGPFERNDTIVRLAFSPIGRQLAIGGQDDQVIVVNAETGQAVAPAFRHASDISGMIFSGDGLSIATASDDNTARVWNLSTGLPRTPFLRYSGSVNNLAMSADRKLLLAGCQSGEVRLWRLRDDSSETLSNLSEPRLAWDDGLSKFRLEARANGAIGIVNRDNSSEVTEFPAGNNVTSVAISDDGTMLLIGDGQGAQIWNWREKQPIGPKVRHGDAITACAFSRDGKQFATGSGDNSARIWLTQTGEPVTPFLRHPGTVLRLRFHAAQPLLLSESRGDFARIWDTIRGEAVSPPLRPVGWVARVFSSRPGEVPWNIPSETRPVRTLTALAERLSGERVDSKGSLAPLTAEELARIEAAGEWK